MYLLYKKKKYWLQSSFILDIDKSSTFYCNLHVVDYLTAGHIH